MQLFVRFARLISVPAASRRHDPPRKIRHPALADTGRHEDSAASLVVVRMTSTVALQVQVIVNSNSICSTTIYKLAADRFDLQLQRPAITSP